MGRRGGGRPAPQAQLCRDVTASRTSCGLPACASLAGQRPRDAERPRQPDGLRAGLRLGRTGLYCEWGVAAGGRGRPPTEAREALERTMVRDALGRHQSVARAARPCRPPPSDAGTATATPFLEGKIYRERPPAASAAACDQHAPAVAAPGPKTGGSLPVTAAIAGAAARCRSDARSAPLSSECPGGRGCDQSGRIGCDRRPLSRSQAGAAPTCRRNL